MSGNPITIKILEQPALMSLPVTCRSCEAIVLFETKRVVLNRLHKKRSSQILDSIRVKYEDGVFKPLKKNPKLKDGALGEVHVDEVHVATTRKRPSVRSSEFFGLWKNRKDMDDGLSYVRTPRSKSRY